VISLYLPYYRFGIIEILLISGTIGFNAADAASAEGD
jgi:hypothetical protein